MKILWVNPSFLDYRIPLYAELNRLLDGQFHLIYGENVIPKRCNDKVKRVLGSNAHGIQDKRYRPFRRNDYANTGLTISIPQGINNIIRDVNPDLIIAEGYFQYSPWAIWRAWRDRRPLMIAYERTAHTERNAQKIRLLYRKFINKFVSGYIANGRLTKEYLMTQGVEGSKIFTGGMCADSFGLAQSCSNFDAAKREVIKTNIGLKKGLTYIFVGRLIPRKGVNHLLVGWAFHEKKYPMDNLLLIGDGKSLESLKSQAKDASLKNVHFIGKINYDSIYQYYAISDVFVIPTLEDNWSLVVPEAMSCGLPIACSIYNGCWPELVQYNVNGTTFDPLKHQTIAEALDYFHHKDLKMMGQESIRIESDFSRDTCKHPCEITQRFCLA